MKKTVFLAIFFSMILAAGSLFAESQKQEVYTDVINGFEIKAPAGWIKDPAPSRYEAVKFKKYQEEGKNLPSISVSVDPALARTKTALEFAQYMIKFWKEQLYNNQSGTLIVVEEPREIMLNGTAASRAIYDLIDPQGKSIRNVDYKLMKDNIVISIQGIDLSSNSNQYLKDFEETANSFKFI